MTQTITILTVGLCLLQPPAANNSVSGKEAALKQAQDRHQAATTKVQSAKEAFEQAKREEEATRYAIVMAEFELLSAQAQDAYLKAEAAKQIADQADAAVKAAKQRLDQIGPTPQPQPQQQPPVIQQPLPNQNQVEKPQPQVEKPQPPPVLGKQEAPIKLTKDHFLPGQADLDKFLEPVPLPKAEQSLDAKKLDKVGKKEVAKMLVTVPDTAKVLINDHETIQIGRNRIFTTPPLDQGRTYVYQLVVILDGVRSPPRDVKVEAGKTTEVNFFK